MLGIKLGACLVFSLYINWTDWKSYKVKNKSVVIFFLLGLVMQLISDGLGGLVSGLGGFAVMLLLFPLFALRMLGAGDVKALMAIGMMLGWPLAGWALVYSIFGAGIIALIILLVRKNGRERLRHLGNYLKLCLYSGSIQSYTTQSEAGQGNFRFTFGITAGLLALSVRQLSGAV